MMSDFSRKLLRPLYALTPRLAFLLVGVAAWSLLCSSWLLQEWLQLNPCPLCIFQRLLYILLGVLALLFALPPFSVETWEGRRNYRVMGALLALLCLGGLGVAIYQTLMQSAPGLVTECSFEDPGPIERLVETLGMYWLDNGPVLPEFFFAAGSCSSKEWTLFGLSLANWSAVSFFGFGLFLAWATRLLPRRETVGCDVLADGT
ncbi:MAG: disulfide bond formation protein B [Zoogloeaceae bacterium]|jgi:disulfide bond formation protein DsbB|nr:disulfide bond formation protein B [Zoogloeaceae bacterium]